MKHLRTAAATGTALLLIAGLAACASDTDTDAEPGAIADCTPAHEFETVEPGVLTVQIVPSLPYIDEDPDGGLTGIDGDIVTEIAALECLDLQVNVVTAPVAISGITGGQADIAAGGWYWTEERGQEVGQTDTIYYDFIGVVSPGGEISTVEELLDKRVGVIEGSLFVEELQGLIGAENVSQYSSTAAVIDDIQNGRLDAGLTGSGEGGYIVSQREGSGLALSAIEPDDRFSPSLSAGMVNIPHTKDNTALTDALNAAIATLREDGTVQAVLTEWGLTSPANFEQ